MRGITDHARGRPRRSHLWVYDDGTGTPGAPSAAGSPAAIIAGVPRIFYRTRDAKVVELYSDAGTAKWRVVADHAAADPAAASDATGPVVTFRSDDGSIVVLRLVNGAWVSDAPTPEALPGGVLPGAVVPGFPV